MGASSAEPWTAVLEKTGYPGYYLRALPEGRGTGLIKKQQLDRRSTLFVGRFKMGLLKASGHYRCSHSPRDYGKIITLGWGDPQGRTDLDPEQGHCPGLDMCRPGRSDAGQKAEGFPALGLAG